MADDDMPIVQPSEYHVPATSMGDVQAADIDQGHKKLTTQEQYKAYKPFMDMALTQDSKKKAKAGLEVAGEALKDKLF